MSSFEKLKISYAHAFSSGTWYPKVGTNESVVGKVVSRSIPFKILRHLKCPDIELFEN